ncbi:MAG: AraC family transcriptional regulator [Pseudonocardiaceae bacterium]
MLAWRWDGLELAVVSPVAGGFPRHSHDEFVVSVNVNGVEDVRLDRSEFEVGTTEVTLYNPGQVQSCEVRLPSDQRWSCVSLYVDPTTMTTLTDGVDEFTRPVARAPSLRQGMLEVAHLLAQGARERDLEGRVIDLAVEAHVNGSSLSEAQTVDRRQPRDHRVEQAMRRLASDVHVAVSLNDLAAELECSRETAVRRFSRVTGVTPYAWHLQRRLAVGRVLLRQGLAPADVATQLGFADQAHFHKHFVKAYATTPGRFRATI